MIHRLARNMQAQNSGLMGRRSAACKIVGAVNTFHPQYSDTGNGRNRQVLMRYSDTADAEAAEPWSA
jgi:hypothetical protein